MKSLYVCFNLYIIQQFFIMQNNVTHVARERYFDNVVINWWHLVLRVHDYPGYVKNCEITLFCS